MKKSLLILFLSLIFAVSCGEGAMKIGAHESEQENEETKTDDDTATDPAADEGETTQDDADTAQEDGDTMPDKDDTIPEDDADPLPDNDENTITDDNNDSDSVTDNDPAPEEEPDDGGECEDGTTRTEKCTDLPQNAVWNTAEYVRQVCGDEGFSPSNKGTYNEEPASSTFENSTPEAKPSLSPHQCPAGTSEHNGVCQIDNCGAFTFRNTISHSTLCGASSNGQKMCLKDKTLCYMTEEDANSQQNPVPCCCDSEIYDVKWGYSLIPPLYEATELTTDGYSVKKSEMFSCQEPLPCEDGFEYGSETDKCYKCSGELSFDGTKYQCSTEIGSECRFKCKEGFNWNGEICTK